MRFTKTKAIFLLLLALSIVFFVFFLTRRIPVESYLIAPGPYEEKILASGIVSPSDTVALTAPLRGQITAIAVEEGDTVQAGQLLISLDATEILLEIEELSAGKAVLEARASELSSRLYPNALENLQQAEREASDALKTLEDARKLYEAGAISRDRYEEISHAYDRSRSDVVIARNDAIALSDSGSARAQIAAEISKFSAQIRSLENERDKHFIHAPVDGVVTKLFSSVGEFAEPASPLLDIIRDESIFVEIALDERYVASVQRGQRVLVSADAYASEKLEGVLDAIAPSVDADTGSVLLKARIKDRRPYLIKNLTVRCEIVTGSFENAVAVPEKFLMEENGAYFVYVFENGKAVLREIAPEIKNASRIRIMEGLAEGDRILFSEKLKDGVAVRLSGVD